MGLFTWRGGVLDPSGKLVRFAEWTAWTLLVGGAALMLCGHWMGSLYLAWFGVLAFGAGMALWLALGSLAVLGLAALLLDALRSRRRNERGGGQ